jgi:hypothetical protein
VNPVYVANYFSITFLPVENSSRSIFCSNLYLETAHKVAARNMGMGQAKGQFDDFSGTCNQAGDQAVPLRNRGIEPPTMGEG